MERRLLLVFALTFLVIILFQPLLKKYLPQPPAHATRSSGSASGAGAGGGSRSPPLRGLLCPRPL